VFPIGLRTPHYPCQWRGTSGKPHDTSLSKTVQPPIQANLNQTMTSQSAPSSPPIEALNAYDDSSFINEDNSHQEHSGDSTRRPAFPAADDRGFNFHPFEVPRRELLVNELPQSPLSLFQHFIPMSIVKEWVKYTNDWVTSLIQRGVVDSQEHEMTVVECWRVHPQLQD
jgi:hypothetical protein